jgi:predicted PhzF superfamily epimerase YddE/YHI9
MEKIPMIQVDAFTNRAFHGNPACVCLLEYWLPDALLLRIAAENAVAETAYVLPAGAGYHLRWFTPDLEMDLCGHATLAAAHALRQHWGFSGNEIHFDSASGPLQVGISGDYYTLDFPSRPVQAAQLPAATLASLSVPPLEVWQARDYLLLYDSEAMVRQLSIDRPLFDQVNMGTGGVIITAPGDEVDFVSRYFTPQSTILEDPVTGSAHCSLTPFWAARLQKQDLKARQVSERGGDLWCRLAGDRVQISGNAVTYSAGVIWV